MRCFTDLIHRIRKPIYTFTAWVTSTSAAWTPQTITNPGVPLFWASKWFPVDNFSGNKPTLDLTGNTGWLPIRARDSRDITVIAMASLGVEDFDVTECPDLTWLDMGQNSLNGTVDISQNVLLTNIDFQTNQIPSLDCTPNINLVNVNIGYNWALLSIDVTTCTNLSIIDVTECNQLVTLDLTGNLLLTKIYANDCNINHGFDFSIHPNVTAINCNYNRIPTMDFRNLTNLTNITANQNTNNTSVLISGCTKLSSMNFGTTPGASGLLDSSGCPAISNWNWTNCRATSYDFSSNLNITILNISIGDWSVIDITMLDKLVTLRTYNNGNTSTLDLSGCIALKTLDIYGTAYSNAVQDQIYIDLDGHGLSNGTLNIDNHTLSAPAVTAKANLVTKGWTINLY
jgi:hypothetical protein